MNWGDRSGRSRGLGLVSGLVIITDCILRSSLCLCPWSCCCCCLCLGSGVCLCLGSSCCLCFGSSWWLCLISRLCLSWGSYILLWCILGGWLLWCFLRRRWICRIFGSRWLCCILGRRWSSCVLRDSLVLRLGLFICERKLILLFKFKHVSLVNMRRAAHLSLSRCFMWRNVFQIIACSRSFYCNLMFCLFSYNKDLRFKSYLRMLYCQSEKW